MKNFRNQQYIWIGLLLTSIFLLPNLFLTNTASAACSPVISLFKADTNKVSKAKPTVTLTFGMSGLYRQGCTNSDLSKLVLWVSAEGVNNDNRRILKFADLGSDWNLDSYTLGGVTFEPFSPGADAYWDYSVLTYQAFISPVGRVTEINPIDIVAQSPKLVFSNTDYVKPGTSDNPNNPNPTGTSTNGTSNIDYKPSVSNNPSDVIKDGLQIDDPTGQSDIMNVILKAINWLLAVLAMVAGIVIIYSGVLYLISRGDPSAVGKAKSTLFMAIFGLVVSVGAFALVNIILGLL